MVRTLTQRQPLSPATGNPSTENSTHPASLGSHLREKSNSYHQLSTIEFVLRIDTFMARFKWRQIPGCPGRCVLQDASIELDALISHHGQTHISEGARDPVWIVTFTDGGGGLLSYRRSNGSFLHTLNTPQGLARKCGQLGIQL